MEMSERNEGLDRIRNRKLEQKTLADNIYADFTKKINAFSMWKWRKE